MAKDQRRIYDVAAVNTISFISPLPVHTPIRAAAGPGRHAPGDSFDPSPPLELDPSALMRTLRSVQHVEKEGHNYSVQAAAVAPDGALYVGYGQYGGPGYVSRVDPGGSISWEAPLDSLRSVTLDDRGVLHALSSTRDVMFDARGTELGRVEFGGSADQAWIDPSNGRGILMRANRLVTADGGPLPEGLPDAPVTEFLPSEDGRTLRLRTRDRWMEVTSSALLSERAVPPNEAPSKKVWVSVDEVDPLPDGGTILQMRRTIEIAAPHGGRGRGHMDFGGGMQEPFNGEYHTEIFYRRLDASGKKVWETDTLEERTRSTVRPDGTLYVATSPAYKKPGCISRVDNNGKLVPIADFDGCPTRLSADENGLLIRYDRTIARLSLDGTREDLKVPEGWAAQRFLPDGRVLLIDFMSTRAALLDPRDGTVTPVTDPKGDHASGRTGELERVARQMPAGDPAPTLEVEPEWIIVDRIRVPRNTDGPARP